MLLCNLKKKKTLRKKWFLVCAQVRRKPTVLDEVIFPERVGSFLASSSDGCSQLSKSLVFQLNGSSDPLWESPEGTSTAELTLPPLPFACHAGHGIEIDILSQRPIATCGRLESWPWDQESWETILVCHLLQHRGSRTLYPTWAVHWSWCYRPWCSQTYLAITRVKALTLWSLPHLVCIVVAWVRERWAPLAL